MYTTVIIEDEQQSIEYLKSMLKEVSQDINFVGAAQNLKDGVNLINEVNPDLVFLDIKLNSDTGFDVLDQVKDKSFNVIFTTAYEQYALKAIKFAAIDYLLKPIDKNELIEAVAKIKNRKDSLSLQKSLSVFFENVNKPQKQKIAISTVSSLIVVEIADILYCSADGPYTNFYLKNGPEKIMSSKNLKEYEELLTDHDFFRIHKSYLVNLKEVKQYLKADGGKLKISNNVLLDVSEKKKEDLIKVLSKEVHFLK
ncbi:MAG: two component transcriptional regulator, LytTR family [Bacteroidetes bacterium]|jgi:two-component system LytT family response regulator|nr:two component transcriptional regulator, LytTR family [Bacteroidota bacterium]